MCEFVSWIEFNDQVLFLTDKQIEETRERLIKWNPDKSEWQGHGAIKLYYGLHEGDGVQKECTDFSRPSNFPEEIQTAIKKGSMTYGIPANIKQLLNQRGVQKYEKVEQPAWEQYQKVQQPAFWKVFAKKEYRKKEWK